MLEILDLQEMNEIKGGSAGFCDSMQKIANESTDWSEADWNRWADSYEAQCMS